MEKSSYTKNSSVRTIRAMDYVLKKGVASLGEIADFLEVDRSSAYRILKAIEGEGYVRSVNRKYCPGYKLSELICFEKSNNDVCNAAKQIMKSIVTKVDGCAHLCMLTESGTEFLSQEYSKGVIHVIQPIGQVEPLYCTASGKASLAFLPEEIQERLIADMKFHPFTEHTLKNAEELRRDLAEVRQRGYATDIEEYHHSVVCICAPVFDRMNISKYAFGISGVCGNGMDADSIRSVAKLVIHAADKLSAALRQSGVPSVGEDAEG